MWASVVEGGARWGLRWSTCQSRADLGHNNMYSYSFCPIFFPLSPFFWFANVSVTKFVAWRSPSVAVVAKTLRLQLKAVSLRRNGVLYDLDAVYSPGHSRKK